jgi:hypothetical protein
VLTLWDLLKPFKDAIPGLTKPLPKKVRPRAQGSAEAAPVQAGPKRRPPARKRRNQPPSPVMEVAKAAHAEVSMEAKYEAMTREMLARYNVRVRKWRTSMSGIAWYVTYRDGHVQRLIESPRPRGPMSAAIFLHEIGHHAIGFNVYKPRCLEEYHAWQFSLREMERLGLNITESVHRRVDRSLRYAVAKAQRRGIREVPAELLPYLPGTKERV